MDVFPVLVGIGWAVNKTPKFNTLVTEAVSGRENRVSLMAFPKWTFSLLYNILRDDSTTSSPAAPLDELKKLVGFFNRQNGSGKAFLYTDPTDNAVVDMQFGVGDGVTTAFQLTRAYGAGGFTFVEPVQNLNGAVTNIKDNGGVVSGANYTVGATGIVTFTVAPTAAHVLTWTGAFYYRVRFLADLMDFSEFMFNLWEARKVEFIGSPGNKV